MLYKLAEDLAQKQSKLEELKNDNSISSEIQKKSEAFVAPVAPPPPVPTGPAPEEEEEGNEEVSYPEPYPESEAPPPPPPSVPKKTDSFESNTAYPGVKMKTISL